MNHTALTVTVNSPSSNLVAASGRNSDDMNKKASIDIVLAGSDVGHDVNKKASVDIVLAGSDVGHMTVCGKRMSTGHTAVHVRAGQTVMLRTHGHSQGESRYRSGWITSFTGMLRQPDL